MAVFWKATHNACKHIHVRACAHTYTEAPYTHTHMNTHTQTHTQTHTHTYTQEDTGQQWLTFHFQLDKDNFVWVTLIGNAVPFITQLLHSAVHELLRLRSGEEIQTPKQQPVQRKQRTLPRVKFDTSRSRDPRSRPSSVSSETKAEDRRKSLEASVTSYEASFASECNYLGDAM